MSAPEDPSQKRPRLADELSNARAKLELAQAKWEGALNAGRDACVLTMYAEAVKDARTELRMIQPPQSYQMEQVKRLDPGLTEFFARLKNAQSEAISNSTGGKSLQILNFNPVSEQALTRLQLLPPCHAKEPKELKFLLRQDYERLCDDLKLADSSVRSGAAIVVGTAGTGKSAFRFYVMRRWMRGDFPDKFDVCIFNLSDAYYELCQDGTVYKLATAGSLSEYNQCALALFDPSELVKGLGRCLHFKFMLVTTSPSPILGQAETCSLSALAGYPSVPIHVSQMWEREEVLAVQPDAHDEVMIAFGCVPRWCLSYSKDDLTEATMKLFSSFTTIEKLRALYDLFKTAVDGDLSPSHELPYRVLEIAKFNMAWGVKGFISNYVARLFLEKARCIAKGLTADFVHMMRNPLGRQALGFMFEEWAFQQLADWAKCDFMEATPMQGRFSASGSFELHHVKTQKAVSGKLECGKLYKAPVGYGSIDMYGVTLAEPGAHLLLFQGTVGHQHRDAQWTHVKNIVLKARHCWPKIRVTLVYLVPREHPFRVPTCSTLREKSIEIVAGSLCADMQVPLETWQASLEKVEA